MIVRARTGAASSSELTLRLGQTTVPAVSQVLAVKTAVEDPETQEERAILLLERAKEAKAPATRAQHLTKALTLLTALPSVKPPAATGSYPNRSAATHCRVYCLAYYLLLHARSFSNTAHVAQFNEHC